MLNSQRGFSLIILLIALSVVLLINAHIYLSSKDNFNPPPQDIKNLNTTDIPSPAASVVVTPSPSPSFDMLQTKNWNDKKFYAYASKESPDLFFLTPAQKADDIYLHGYIVSTAADIFIRNSLFEVIEDRIYVINSRNDAIDVYKIDFSKEPNWQIPFKYEESIKLPKHEAGYLYAIQCQDRLCTVRIAFHLEAGCSSKLDVTTKKFTKDKCWE